ncbi:MAG: hypothetical protein M4579_004589 [Chaenotheca gracillima]|nr:MAG: hypothetical protein M4579_004589 [Chaenotheca gracillima]
MRLTTVLGVATSALLTVVNAHVEMTWPYPIRSKYDPETPSNLIDYSMTSPLLADGSNYPCKGYNKDEPTHTVITYDAGSTYNISLTGSATHGGGSCQLSLSYDNGKTFKVIESIIGGCPLTETYDFTLPDYTPGGSALFAWTWFNLVGNREMYMDCARVQIDNSGSSSQSKFKSLPNMYVANVGDKGDCTTVESQQLVFNDPGTEVIYGGGVTKSSPKAPGVCTGGNDGSSDSDSGSSDSAEPTSAVSLKSTPTTFATVVTSSKQPSTTGIKATKSVDQLALLTWETRPSITSPSSVVESPSSTDYAISYSTTPSPLSGFSTSYIRTNKSPTATKAPSSPSSTRPVMLPPRPSPLICTPNTPVCKTSDPHKWSLCSSLGTSLIPMGQLAPGTACLPDGTIGRDPSKPNGGLCSANQQGMIQCGEDKGQMWLVCDDRAWVNMGNVAPGTICVGGRIVAAGGGGGGGVRHGN